MISLEARLRRSWLGIAILSAVVVLVVTGAVVWFLRAEVLPQQRVRVSDVEAKIANALPKGSSEADAMTFLQAHDYAPLTARRATASDGFLGAQGVPLGTLVIEGHIDHSSRRGLLEAGRITIFIILDDNRLVDRAYVFERLTGP